MCIHHRGYWCPGAKTPGQQHPLCWLIIHCIGSVLYRNITVIKLHVENKYPKIWLIEAKWCIYASVNWPPLVQIMIVAWMVPSHYLNHWWNVVIWTRGTIFSEIQTFSFEKIHFKILSGKLQPFCFRLSVLRVNTQHRSSIVRECIDHTYNCKKYRLAGGCL